MRPPGPATHSFFDNVYSDNVIAGLTEKLLRLPGLAAIGGNHQIAR